MIRSSDLRCEQINEQIKVSILKDSLYSNLNTDLKNCNIRNISEQINEQIYRREVTERAGTHGY